MPKTLVISFTGFILFSRGASLRHNLRLISADIVVIVNTTQLIPFSTLHLVNCGSLETDNEKNIIIETDCWVLIRSTSSLLVI